MQDCVHYHCSPHVFAIEQELLHRSSNGENTIIFYERVDARGILSGEALRSGEAFRVERTRTPPTIEQNLELIQIRMCEFRMFLLHTIRYK